MLPTATEIETYRQLIIKHQLAGKKTDVIARIEALPDAELDELKTAVSRLAYDCEVTLQSMAPYTSAETERLSHYFNLLYRMIVTAEEKRSAK